MTRDHLGRILGKLEEFWNNEDENWFDKKIHSRNIRFPKHDEDRVYPVITRNINELNK
ncbi:hypothetical protein [Robertmurraya siralis]|uniref:hypothetical protein n=1 Tax=Robertmurraya siralis TaxID=77777 RepID=UPI0014769079|nr:hypothetical protein [Robertmurraya siralis]